MDDDGLIRRRGQRRVPAWGTLAMLRNLAGLAGVGLLSAAVLGGAVAWADPVA